MPKDLELEKLVQEEQQRQSRIGAQGRGGFKESQFDPGARREAPPADGWPIKQAD